VKVGDLVKLSSTWSNPDRKEYGVVLKDHSPMRPLDLQRVVDVLWNDGQLEEFWSGDLEVFGEAR
jgi:hypothetical protein